MPEQVFPKVSELLPHRGPAVLLDRVLAHDEAQTTCLVRVSASRLFLRQGGWVPAWIGLEYMAQTIAAHGGLLDRAASRSPRPGLFLGSRRLAFATDRFDADSVLEASARFLRGGGSRVAGAGATGAGSNMGMLAFDCSIRAQDSGEVLVSGILNVYLVESFEALNADFRGDQNA